MRGLPHSLPRQKSPVCLSCCAERSLGHRFFEADANGWFQAGISQWWQKMIVTSPSAGCVVQYRIADMIDEAHWWGIFAA